MATDDERAACRRRLDRLRQHLGEAGLGAALLVRPEHLRYLAGHRPAGGPAALVVTREAAVLVAPSGGASAQDAAALGIDLIPYPGYDAGRLVDRAAAARVALGDVVRRLALRDRVGVEADHVPYAALRAVDAAEPCDLAPTLAAWRVVKDEVEQALIRARVRMLDRAFEAARQAIRPGATERDLLAAVHGALLDLVEEPLVVNGNLASGLRTALDNPHATARRLERGDLVLLDLYPILDGYAADCTRTFVVGEPSPLQRERHAALEAGLRAAEALLRPGADVGAIDRSVREALRTAGGYDRTMIHHSGHGLGLLAWEDPWLGPGAEGPLIAGTVLAIEPGLYLPGWGGMRLEGNYLITPTGYERLDAFLSTLIAAGA